MLTFEFATLEATSNSVEIIVRYVEPVKQEMEIPRRTHPEDPPLSETDELKRRIHTKVIEHLNERHFPTRRAIVCRNTDELVKAIEKAKAAHDLALALIPSGRYAPPIGPPDAYTGRGLI